MINSHFIFIQICKSSDVLSKYVGQAEKQLRDLFEQAKTTAPSVIFFDEIDGLAPARSSRTDKSTSSTVSTLLSMMDGTYKHFYLWQNVIIYILAF